MLANNPVSALCAFHFYADVWLIPKHLRDFFGACVMLPCCRYPASCTWPWKNCLLAKPSRVGQRPQMLMAGAALLLRQNTSNKVVGWQRGLVAALRA